ncbi:Ubiquitin carboxyl-terminal hydrolase 18 [Morella rubra]|uniref:Alkaline/neutral invertase n=1 Tax=Morella rubra TaxID=262757 RepID=A0A6A1W3S9_9ROSI|nr:Ubiquitin carboxyl-terminal hydrolase 18 [Morella rubra]
MALRCALAMLKPDAEGNEFIERIVKRLHALSFHMRSYFWLDFQQLNDIYRYKTEEYSHTAVNKFNVIPDSIPEWLFDFMPIRGGYFIGNVSPARMDFRWFALGNCVAILSSLATPEQSMAIMDLIESRWEELVGEMPLKICYPAIESHEWRIVTGCDPKNTRWSYHNGGSWPGNRNDWCFLCEFETHVERASQSLQAFSPINILSRLPNIGGNLGYGRQEDAHEFMRFAIDTMQSICLDDFGGEKAVEPSSQETTLIQHIFGGHLQSQVICTKCNNVSNQYENMMDLTVEIHGDASSLEECLDQFTVKEWLHGENMYKCDGCNDYVKAWKRLTVKRAPNILTIALKRFQSGRFGKLNKRVMFPETLDLSPYMSEAGDGTDLYKLYAVVVHVDMLNASFFGHYICYTKDFRGNWYRIDDCKVTNVELEEVLSQGAYMLLYCRVCARPTCLRTVEHSGKDEQPMVQVEVAPCPKEQVECFATAEISKHINIFAAPSDISPCLLFSISEEDPSTVINSIAKDLEDVRFKSSSPSLKEVSGCKIESSVGIAIDDSKEDQDGIYTVDSATNSPVSKEFSRYKRDSTVALNPMAGRGDPEDTNMVPSEGCLAEKGEVSFCEIDSSVSIDCKYASEDSQDTEVESRPCAKDIEVYGNGHTDGIIPCPVERGHKLVSAESHKLQHESPLCNSGCEDPNGSRRVELTGSSF